MSESHRTTDFHELPNSLQDTTTPSRDPANDEDWSELASAWRVRPDMIYLNHGSFGIAPDRVRHARRGFMDRLDENPMDFYLRQMEALLLDTRQCLADFVQTDFNNLVLVDNATYGMNVVANSFQLETGDEVLLNNHEYGAVQRIWDRKCNSSGANVITADLPEQFESEEQIVAALMAGVTKNTKLAIVSHITSPTALIMPAKKICHEFSRHGIAVCIDGPHAPAQIDVNLEDIGCDFYTASCHKWLCATLGSGFLFAHPRWHDQMQPIMKSWGRLLPAIPETWDEQFTWLGSRDPSGYLSIPVAIDFLNRIGPNAFRERTYWLAGYAESALTDLFGTNTIGRRSSGWYGSMAHVPLPPGDWSNLQRELWEQVGIEVPIIFFDNRWFIRVSCHLYNTTTQIDTLINELSRLCCRTHTGKPKH